jgi:hypothetical protein
MGAAIPFYFVHLDIVSPLAVLAKVHLYANTAHLLRTAVLMTMVKLHSARGVVTAQQGQATSSYVRIAKTRTLRGAPTIAPQSPNKYRDPLPWDLAI